MRNLAQIIVVGALIEFLCLRLLLRLGPMLPPGETTTMLANGMVFVGVSALNFVLLLMLVALVEHARHASRAITKFLSMMTIVLALILFVVENATSSPLYFAFVLVAWLSIGDALIATRLRSASLLWCGLLAATFFLLAYSIVALTLPFTLVARPIVLALAELLAVSAAISAPFVLRPRFDARAAVVGTIGAIVLGGMWFGAAWLPPTMMIWTLAFTGVWSPFVYVPAFGLFLYTLVALAIHVETRQLAIGLLLIALGGLRWDYMYYVLLAMLGVGMLVRALGSRQIEQTSRQAISPIQEWMPG